MTKEKTKMSVEMFTVLAVALAGSIGPFAKGAAFKQAESLSHKNKVKLGLEQRTEQDLDALYAAERKRINKGNKRKRWYRR